MKRNHSSAVEQGDGPGEEVGTSGLGHVYCNQGDLKRAVEFEHRLSLLAAISLEDWEGESKAYEVLASGRF